MFECGSSLDWHDGTHSGKMSRSHCSRSSDTTDCSMFNACMCLYLLGLHACVLLCVLLLPTPSLTVVMAFKAVSAPMLRSEPGTLLETVAGTMTMGTQNSSYFSRAVNNSSSDRKACRAEPRALVWTRVGILADLVERCYLPQGKVRQKWREPRGGARSITTDSSETDRYHSIHTHAPLIYLHTSQKD